jgi:hypothetical protein
MTDMAMTTAATTPAPTVAAPRKAARDLRLDFFRGLSLFFIFVDHIPENLLSYFTLHTVAFSDAAEVFIFISGYTAALVYGRSLSQHGFLFALAQIYRRVWQLYVAHIFLFVIFVAEVSYTVLAVQNPMYTEELGVGDFLDEPHVAIIRALVLAFQPTFLDILPLYIVLLAVFPLVLAALERHPLLPLTVSAVVYVLTLRFGWALRTYPQNHVWFFNPLAWQFLFVIGATAGHARISGRWPFPEGPWFSRAALALSLFFGAVSLTWVLHWVWDPFPTLLLKPLWSHTIDKTNLAPLRLLNFLALAIATMYLVPPESGFLRWSLSRPVILCGQHSLYVFCLGILLSVLGHFVLAEFYDGFLVQVAVNLAGVSLMIACAELLEWYKRAGRPPPGAPVPATASE